MRKLFVLAITAGLVLLPLLALAGDVKPMTVAYVHSPASPITRAALKQDPAPAPAPPATVGDLIKALATAKASQATAQATADAATKALADANTALTAQAATVVAADTAIKAALAQLGPIIVGGVVYEPTADGGYRSFTPATADTVLPVPKPAGP